MIFCRPTNSVKAVKGKNITFHELAYNGRIAMLLISPLMPVPQTLARSISILLSTAVISEHNNRSFTAPCWYYDLEKDREFSLQWSDTVDNIRPVKSLVLVFLVVDFPYPVPDC